MSKTIFPNIKELKYDPTVPPGTNIIDGINGRGIFTKIS